MNMADAMNSKTLYLYGHSHPNHLRRMCEENGTSYATLFQRTNDNVLIEGHGGLSYDRLFDSPDHYTHRLRQQPIDVLCVDMGTNDLCHPNVSPDKLVELTEDFLDTMRMYRIRPKITVFLSVLKRTFMSSHPNQVSLHVHNQRVDEFNRRLSDCLALKYPTVQLWSQEPYNHPPLIHGCHLSPAGRTAQIGCLRRMFHTTCNMVDQM